MDLELNGINNDNSGKKRKNVSKKLLSIGLSTTLALGTLAACPQKAYGYDSKTHKFLASQGILMLKKDKGEDVVGKLYKDNGARLIMDYSIMPDFDEIDGGVSAKGGFKGHYYDPATQTNFMGEKDDTAKINFDNHYDAAVQYFKDGKKEDAWKELGRALHYLGDLNEPHHAGNLPAIQANKIQSLIHVIYEGWVEKNNINYTINTAPSNIYDDALGKTTLEIGHNAAVNSKRSLYLIKNLYYGLDDGNKRLAAKNTLPYAQKDHARVLYKFLVDVGEITPQVE